MLSGVGHRVMVPPSPGTRGGAGASVRRTGHAVCTFMKPLPGRSSINLYKDGRRTHSHRLWCSDGPWEKLTADQCDR
ncbi:hypothetical protein SHJG_5100 [Streptomyces hygroscopicus subsp. jinggangensis 5008]|nr:hypothetical protein SHJG_5100 [Streptomyces hygroscopicus subsp. jinggangensis 5008]AGF64526.1 hypothetical protein SHJGH_4863 [Streptomyces hygroscopicus subsp. jinggangensis TL01]